MATALDLLLVDQFTAGINAPGPLDDGKLARVAVDDSGRANLEYVSITVGLDGANVKDYGAIGNGTIDDSAAISSAFASGEDLVYFPPGTYKIGANITASADDQTIRMAPGAELLPAAGIGVTFSGARQCVENFVARVATTSSATYSVVTVSGASSRLRGANVEVTADVANATLIRLAGDDVRARDLFIKSNCSFLRGVSIADTDDSITQRCVINGIETDIAPSTSKTYESILDSRGSYAVVRDLEVTTGTNVAFSKGVVRQRTSNLTLDNPQIFAQGAQYGVWGDGTADAGGFTSEKLTILQGSIQGRNNGTYVASSYGLRVGHQCGHQKIYGTFINGFKDGVLFTGSADTPCFYGAIIANNDDYAFVIDAGSSGAVRGLTISGCYLSDVQQDAFMHVISGKVDACLVSSSEIGYTTVALLVEDAVLGCAVKFDNCFIQGSGGGVLGIAQPNAASTIIFTDNTLQGGNTLGYGTYASKAVNPHSSDATFSTVTTTTSLQIGATGNPILKRFFTYFTANFGSGIGANSAVELDFSWSDGGVATQKLTAGISGAIAANTSLSIDAVYVKSAGTVTLRMRNNTGTPVGAISGTVFFESTKEVL